MSKVKLGNGPSVEAYLRGRNADRAACDCLGADVGLVLT